jgi:hypothetical protein
VNQLVQRDALFMWLPLIGSILVIAFVLWRVTSSVPKD